MKSGADVVRRVIWRKDLDEMEVIGTRMFSVGVPIEADPEFKAYVFAAGVTHSMGNNWVDAQLRRHREKWIDSFRPEQSKPGSAEQLMRIVRTRALMRVDELTALDLSGASSGAAAAANVLIRLASTFRGALQLVRLGFAFESEAVIRLGFEQISWAYEVAPLTDVGEIERTSSTKSITKLKELLPAAGRIYGRLSELAHVVPDTHHRFVSIDNEDKVKINIQARDATRESLLLLVLLLDALYAVSEARFHVYGIACSSLNHARRWAATGGDRMTICEIDLRVGGDFHHVFVTPDGRECSFRGTYLEIEPPSRVVNTWLFEGWKDAWATETNTLSKVSGVTTLTLTLAFRDKEGASNMRRAHADAARRGDTNGQPASFDAMEDLLSSLLEQKSARESGGVM